MSSQMKRYCQSIQYAERNRRLKPERVLLDFEISCGMELKEYLSSAKLKDVNSTIVR